MMKHIQLYALFLLFVFHTSCKQNKTAVRPKFVKSDIVDTVMTYGPNTMVRHVKNGRNGTILFAASRAGVFRYDARLNDGVGKGKSFTNIASKIGSRRYWDVLEDRKGNYWFATTDSGAYYYNSTSYQHFSVKEGLASNSVLCIYEDKAGTIWFGTQRGVSHYDGTSFENFTTKNGLSHNGIHTILEDKTGKMWFGTAGDACYYDGKTFTVFKNKDGKPFYNVWAIIEDQKGNIWFDGSIKVDKKRMSDKGIIQIREVGLWRYDGDTYTRVSKRGASAMIEDSKGNIWTTGSLRPPNGKVWALSRYDQKSLYDERPAVTEITSIEGPGMLCGLVEASDGSIWYGALGTTSGVFRYDGKTITDFRKKEDEN